MPDNEQTIADAGLEGTSLATESTAATAKAQADAPVAPITPLSNQIQQGAAPAKITNQDLFPGMNQNINVGSSSSKTLGSQPIFVAAGQYVPYNILNKKDEAIATATKKRAERQARFDPGKAGKLNNQLYQRKLNDRFNTMNSDFISTAQKMDPDNWDVMLNNPGSEIGKAYAQQKSNFEVLATESNVQFDRAAFVMAQKEKGGRTQFSPETTKFASEMHNRMGDAAEGSLEDLRGYTDEFNGSFSLDKHLFENKYVTQMKAEITSLLAPGGGGMSVEQEANYEKKARQMAISQTSPGGTYDGDNMITEDIYYDRLIASLGTQKTKKFKRDPAPTTFDKKGLTQDELLKERIRTFKEAQKDPKGNVGRSIMQGYTGTKRKGLNVKDVKILDPSDWNKSVTEQFDPLIAKLLVERKEYDDHTFFHQKDLVVKNVTQAIKDAGVTNKFSVKYRGDKESNIFDIELKPGRFSKDQTVKKISLNIDDPKSTEEFKQLFMGSVYGGTDFQNEAVSVSNLANNDGDVMQEERLRVNSPEWVSITNDIANNNAGELINIQGDKVLKGMGYGGTSHLQKQNLKKENQEIETEVKPSTLAELKSSGQYDDSVKRTMNDAKVGKAEAIKMIEAHYKNKK